MVREVVDDRDAADRAALLQPALHSAKSLQRLQRGLRLDADVLGRHQCRQRVQPVVMAGKIELQFTDGATVPGDEIWRVTPHLPLAAASERDPLRPAAAFQDARQRGLAGVHDDAGRPRQRADEVVELRFDGCQVGKDVGVVELEVVQDRGARKVVDELRALVEERRVVLVGLDDEGRRGAEQRGTPEVLRHAAHEEPRIQPRAGQDPGEHRCGRRLAVRSRDGQHVAPAQDVFRQPLRARDERQLPIEDRLHQRIAAGDHVADHVQVGAQLELARFETLDQFDAGFRQLVAHRRVHVGVAAADAMAGGTGELRQPAHEGAADAEDVDVHGGFAVAEPSAISEVKRREIVMRRNMGPVATLPAPRRTPPKPAQPCQRMTIFVRKSPRRPLA